MNTPRIRSAAVAVIAVIMLTFTGCATTTPAPEAESIQPIRIGAWNIEWLGQPNRRSGPAKGVGQSPEDLADYIAASGVSVVALQEIKANAPANPPDGSQANTTLNETFSLLNSEGGGDWRHVVFTAPGNQNVGVAWDANAVTLLSDRAGYIIPIERITSAQGKTVWHRPPRAMFFSAGDGLTDFVIIPIHMKSNYGGDFSVHRAAEAGVLATALPQVMSKFADYDVMVIGDTNSPNHDDESIRIFEEAGLIDLNDADASTYWRGSALDRILVSADQPEFAEPMFEVFFDVYAQTKGIDLTDFKVRWSDHQMVVFTLRVMDDDD